MWETYSLWDPFVSAVRKGADLVVTVWDRDTDYTRHAVISRKGETLSHKVYALDLFIHAPDSLVEEDLYEAREIIMAPIIDSFKDYLWFENGEI